MSRLQSSFTIDLDVTNPGHVIACCGLLELAHRQWSEGVEGWFDGSRFMIAVPEESGHGSLRYLVEILAGCEISGLSNEERDERERLERESRELKKQEVKLPTEKEERRKELGELARVGVIRIGEPFDMVLDWWQTGYEEGTPKTWAGRQELHRIARAAQDALSGIGELTTLLDYGCVLRMPKEYRKGKSDHKKTVEPFYFDARRFAHALDTGFSLDTQDAETVARPAVELLCLIGLQRFRPAVTPEKRSFDYWTWFRPLNAPVAAAVFSGVSPIPSRRCYRFHLRFRDDQKRYKAFSVAIPSSGGDS